MQREQGLLAGASRVVLGYPQGFFPHTSFRGRYFTGVHDDLYARALYLSSGGAAAVWVSVDLGDVGDSWIAPVARAAGVPKENVFICATHTHASPHAEGTWDEDVKDVEAGRAFAGLCLKAVLEAVAAARERAVPARVGFGADVCHINVNRDYKYRGTSGKVTAPYIQAPNPGGISDKTVSCLRFEDLNGRCLACLMNYAVHSNVTFYQTWSYESGMLISGDIAGYAARYVEERGEEGMVALFTMGAAADQMPRYLANHRTFDRENNVGWEYCGQEAGFALMEAQAADLGAAALGCLTHANHLDERPLLRAAATAVTAGAKVKGAGKPLPSGSSGTDYSQQYNEALNEGFAYEPAGQLVMPLGMLRLGSVILVCVPGEIVTSIGLEIKRAVMRAFDGEVIVVSQCNGSYSYIADDEGYRAMTFEAVASHFMPGIGKKIVAGVEAMLAGALA